MGPKIPFLKSFQVVLMLPVHGPHLEWRDPRIKEMPSRCLSSFSSFFAIAPILHSVIYGLEAHVHLQWFSLLYSFGLQVPLNEVCSTLSNLMITFTDGKAGSNIGIEKFSFLILI